MCADIALRKLGKSLGFGKGEVACIGTCTGYSALIYGEALYFPTDFYGLARELYLEGIGPILRGEPVGNRVVRFLPNLQKMRSFKI